MLRVQLQFIGETQGFESGSRCGLKCNIGAGTANPSLTEASTGKLTRYAIKAVSVPSGLAVTAFRNWLDTFA
ncbi:MAG: hypothetical protein DRQ63_04180 [Gammaproteobacteria bacterium]|nr:MAG: hypothetical protein DRQ63_04180 [Gammaproteobacteria bacterium]